MGKRDAILDAVADFILSEGIEAAKLRALAEAAGQSDRMLLYYFRDKEELVAAALDQIAERMKAALEAARSPQKLRKAALHERLDAVMLDKALWPYWRCWLDIAARAARQDPLCVTQAKAMGRGFHDWIETQLATANADLRRAEATEIMLGLQGVVLLKAVGMMELVRELV